MGRHEEKLDKLEIGQEDLKQDIKELKDEMKEDIRELVSAIKDLFTEKHLSLEKRVDKVEDVIMWTCGGIVATLGLFVWSKVAGG